MTANFSLHGNLHYSSETIRHTYNASQVKSSQVAFNKKVANAQSYNNKMCNIMSQ